MLLFFFYSADATCPLDGVKFDVDNVLMNIELGYEVNNLKVKCSFYRKNCAWEGVYGELPVRKEFFTFII